MSGSMIGNLFELFLSCTGPTTSTPTMDDLRLECSSSYQVDAKLLQLCSHPIASELRAVKNQAFITVPFSTGSLGVRFRALAYNVALARSIPISQINLSQISIRADGDVGGQGVARSGVRVYTRLPVFTGANLEDVCPGSYTVKDWDQPSASRGTMSKATASDKIPAIILMSLQVAVVPVAAIKVEVLVSR
jgi:hypothetical protein